MKSYIVNILSLSIVISIVSVILFYFFIPQYYLQIFPVTILVFIATNVLVYFLLAKAGKKNARQFSSYFMGSAGIKLLIYMLFVVIYCIIDKPNSINFVIQFFVLYAIYTVFETRAVIKTLRNQNDIEK